MSRFFSQSLSSLVPYVPGEQPQNGGFIKLNTNENPYPPSPAVLKAIDANRIEKLRLYSDPASVELNSAIASRLCVPVECVISGNGSDEILAFAFLAFAKDRGARFADITYGFYKVFADLYNVEKTVVPLKEDYRIDPIDYAHSPQAVFIANPNAPTGIAMTLDEIEYILQNNIDSPVVIDEAYVDFGAESAVGLVEKYDNLIVVQTFSKSRSLAGMRIGFAVASPSLIADLNRVKFSFNPYNLDRLACAAGKAAMDDGEYFAAQTARIIATRERTVSALVKLGFTVLVSSANFVFAKCPTMGGKAFYSALRERKILVRHFDGGRTRDFVRVSIGTDDEMDKFLSASKDISGR